MIAPGILAGVAAFLASVGAFAASSPFWLSSVPVTVAVILVPPPAVVLLVLLVEEPVFVPWRRSASSPTYPFSTAGGTLVGGLIGQIGSGWAPPFITWWYGPLLFPAAFTYAAFALSSMATRPET